jgi:hypothetical protein
MLNKKMKNTMKKSKLTTAGQSIAIAILVLGIIHVIATFTPIIQEGLGCLDNENLKAMIFMSLMCGSAFILSGLLLFLLLKKLEQFAFLISPILVISIFCSIGGILSVIYMPDNPFAWIIFLPGLAILCISVLLKQK